MTELLFEMAFTIKAPISPGHSTGTSPALELFSLVHIPLRKYLDTNLFIFVCKAGCQTPKDIKAQLVSHVIEVFGFQS